MCRVMAREQAVQVVHALDRLAIEGNGQVAVANARAIRGPAALATP